MPLRKLFVTALIIALAGCSKGASSTHEVTGDGGTGDGGATPVATVRFNVADVSTVTAAELLRPGITADGIDSYDNYDSLGSFLTAEKGRVGMVLYDGIDNVLRKLPPPPNTAAQLEAGLAAVDAKVVAPIVDAGGTVLLNVYCGTPDFLSKLQGYDQYVLSGKKEASALPIYSCAPPRDQAAYDAWEALMGQVAAFFNARHGDKVVYLFGREPETYFAGSFAELTAQYKSEASGVLAAVPGARLAGITPVYGSHTLNRAFPAYQAGTDSFSYTAEDVGAPLLQKWIEFSVQESLPIDFITFHLWNANPRSYKTSEWVAVREEIDGWLQAAGYGGRTPTVLATDVPGWQNACTVDPDDTRRSYWDSAYMSALFAADTIETTRDNLAHRELKSPTTGDLGIVYGYLIQVGSYASCMPVEAGFNGVQGITNKLGIPKPSRNTLHLMTLVDGLLGAPESTDPSIQVIGGWDNAQGSVSLLLSRFVPSELEYVAKENGGGDYHFGAVFNNTYGVQRSPLDPTSVSQRVQDYLKAADAPKGFVRDLMSGPTVLDVADLGFPPDWSDYYRAVQSAGMTHRTERVTTTTARISIEGLPAGTWQLQERAVDSSHGNAYAQRDEVQKKLVAAKSAGTFDQTLAGLQSDWGADSTVVSSGTVTVDNGTAAINVDLEPNAVMLVQLHQ